MGGGTTSSRDEGSGKPSYKTLADVWAGELAGKDGRRAWYAKASEYWEGREATLSGILGGFPETNVPDLRESRQFLERLRRKSLAPDFKVVLDCGAGTGRVAAGLLAGLFERVDLLEQDERLLAAARRDVPAERAGRFMRGSMQDFLPEEDSYDVIWVQWVIMYLPDDDLIQFLQRCILGLRENGVICIKDNVVFEGEVSVDWDDNSVTRLDSQYKAIFGRAGLYVLQEAQQADWPDRLIPAKMYALRPKPGLKGPTLPLPAGHRSCQQQQQQQQDEGPEKQRHEAADEAPQQHQQQRRRRPRERHKQKS